MKCQFVGEFTEEEKRSIRSSLEALTDAARSQGIEGESGWRVEWHVGEEEDGEEGERELRAVHEESGVELWGRTADDLARSIDKTADFLRSSR